MDQAEYIRQQSHLATQKAQMSAYHGLSTISQNEDQDNRWQDLYEQNKLLEALYHDLKHEVYSTTKAEWIRPDHVKPLLTDEGVQELIFTVRSILNKNTVLNYLEYRDIQRMLRRLGGELTLKLALNQQKWAIQKSNLDTIRNSCIRSAELILKRSDKGRTYEFMKPVVKFVDNFRSGSPPTERKRKGLDFGFGGNT